ncbi:MAG: sugar phosphorylase [Desulfobacterales bacterium]|nr:sugar phosphorylase [Desulfobacterales bacterium]
MKQLEDIRMILVSIYGEDGGQKALKAIVPLIESFPVQKSLKSYQFSEKDIVLITYGDTIEKDGEMPLSTFSKFADKYLKGVFSAIHFLPFYPYSSDDGFSVIDFHAIRPDIGDWDDVAKIGENFTLMFDFVLNHISSKSGWFKNYLNGADGFKDLAIEVDPSVDLSGVTRPRTCPLLTEIEKTSGEHVHVWTTFSDDQIDINFESIEILEKMIEVLLFYVKRGASILRMDAIAYLWKEIGTSCIHLRRTHDIIKLFRKILDIVAPHVLLITETNVPHDENISYFGNGIDEAQMVYNFTLPPLLFYTFLKEDSSILSEWAKGLNLDSVRNTFFNFTASHDGIGVRPLEGILPKEDVELLAENVKKNGGRTSYKNNPDGTRSPYELNITYVDALIKKEGNETDALHVKRFLASQVIQYSLPGVPATYIHSLLGSHNWEEGIRQTGRARSINREKLNFDRLEKELESPETFRFRIYTKYSEMIKIRRKQPAFNPTAYFEIIMSDPKVFVIKRACEAQTLYSITNISSEKVSISLKKETGRSDMEDLFTGKNMMTDSVGLEPYQCIWLV